MAPVFWTVPGPHSEPEGNAATVAQARGCRVTDYFRLSAPQCGCLPSDHSGSCMSLHRLSFHRHNWNQGLQPLNPNRHLAKQRATLLNVPVPGCLR